MMDMHVPFTKIAIDLFKSKFANRATVAVVCLTLLHSVSIAFIRVYCDLNGRAFEVIVSCVCFLRKCRFHRFVLPNFGPF